MLVPLVALAAGALGAGYVGVTVGHGGFIGFIEPHGWFHTLLEPVVEPYKTATEMNGTPAHASGHMLMYVSGALALAGLAAAYVFYARRRNWAEAARRSSPVAHEVLHNKYFVDELNDAVIVRPLHQTGRLCFGIDRYVVDGLVWAVSVVPRALGVVLRPLQNGAMQSYGVSMTAGMVVIVLIVWLLSGR
jgi:NADH-quinone oxidoreductase subunit L